MSTQNLRPTKGPSRVTRRRLLKSGLAFGSAALVARPSLAETVATPRQTTGPFYPATLPLDADSDLVQVQGRPSQAEGQVLHLFGQVRSQSGQPLPGLRLEIWQCDAQGRYHHPRDPRGPADPNFQGFGRRLLDDEGAYRFRTIRPVPYPGRAPHIHVALAGQGIEGFTTQMYVAGEPFNARDFLLRRIEDETARQRLIVPLNPAPELEDGALSARFDIILDDKLIRL